MTCDIFIRSYWKDVQWLELCLASIAGNALGFRSVVVVVPRATEPWLRRIRPFPCEVRLELCDGYGDDYLGQQVTKLHADRYTDADFICHLDADCIVSQPMRPAQLLTDTRPTVFTRRRDRLGRHWPWGGPTEAFLGWRVEHDYMQRPPFVYPRWLYGEVRGHAVDVHGADVATYVTAQPPRGFSEFNVLGAFAHRWHRDDFLWTDVDAAAPEPGCCRWYSSWEGVGAFRPEIERLLGRPGR